MASPQPGGLEEGSRWSFRAWAERPPVSGPRLWRTPAGVPEPVRFGGRNSNRTSLHASPEVTLWHPSGMRGALAIGSGGLRPGLRPPATFWHPSGMARRAKIQTSVLDGPGPRQLIRPPRRRPRPRARRRRRNRSGNASKNNGSITRPRTTTTTNRRAS